MQIEYYKEYSHFLDRDMQFKSYGWAGKPVLAFPCQDGRFYEWEDFGMLSVLEPWLDSGKIRLFTVDSYDKYSISAKGDPYRRIRVYENWYHYVTEELVPRIHEITGNGDKLLATGLSMGAYNAANIFFRRSDLFDGLIALSGCYDTSGMYGGYMDEVVYMNDPCISIGGMPADHPYIALYHQSHICICVGQGAWEWELLAATRRFEPILRSKGINAWVDYWGYDVNHDWPWWKKQIVYFLGHIIP